MGKISKYRCADMHIKTFMHGQEEKKRCESKAVEFDEVDEHSVFPIAVSAGSPRLTHSHPPRSVDYQKFGEN